MERRKYKKLCDMDAYQSLSIINMHFLNFYLLLANILRGFFYSSNYYIFTIFPYPERKVLDQTGPYISTSQTK